MFASLKALLTGLIDYAGMFPPTKLPLGEALHNHIRYCAGPDAWMLGRFICPAARLEEVAAFEDLFQQTPGFTISALGRGGASMSEFLDGLRADLADVVACRERHAGRIVDMLEVRLPAEPLTGDGLLSVAKWMRSAGLSLFFETPVAESLPFLLQRIRETPFEKPAGFKLRCGGLEPSAFPSCAQIAVALKACLAAGVPFKATAGLHHPFPRFDPGVGARKHGFINLFTAGVLLHTCGITADRAAAILEDDDPAHFALDDHGLRWQELSASTDQIAFARRHSVLSFGSCSFDEPRNDLRTLGWW